VLSDTGLDAHRLQIEITESTALANTVHTRATLNALRADGVRVALDDFGVGFSSLAQLRDLPVDALKIDRSFVQAVLRDRKTAAIVDSIALLARRLGLEVVAEGVEQVAEAEYFEALGIQKTNAVAAMSDLESRGFIVRKTSSSDARSYKLHLTARGKRFMKRAGEVHAKHEQRLIDRIGVEGRDQLLRLLGKLTNIK
jgi:predicted signal transduction protein with EAL and GGDEF domain